MIPKIIHYVWLSGEEKPQIVKECIRSWHNIMPDYKIKEWNLYDVNNINSGFLHSAIKAKKWAFATDFLRFYIIYNYGGIYMDSDVYVYQSFNSFLSHKGFSCIELWPNQFFKTALKKNPKGIGIEAAVFGAEKGSKWIQHILDFYKDKIFINDPKYYNKISAPSVMRRRSIGLGFKDLPLYQTLEGDIHIYPPDTFSSCNYKLYLKSPNDYKLLGSQNKLKYACHLCNNSWGYIQPQSLYTKAIYLIKKTIIKCIGKKNVNRIKKHGSNKQI